VRPARRLLAVAALAVAMGGCAWIPFRQLGPGAEVLVRADRLTRAGAWEDAVHVYGDYLADHPDAEAAPRAAASRDTLLALLGARAELASRRDELAVRREQLAVQRREVVRLREELTRLREELTRRDSDLVRVRQEAERLKTDLERLKAIDLKLERRK
jgi:hypothetical protein